MRKIKEVIVGGDTKQTIVGQMATEGIGFVGDRVGDVETQTELRESFWVACPKRPIQAGGVRIVECQIYRAHPSYYDRTFWPPLERRRR